MRALDTISGTSHDAVGTAVVPPHPRESGCEPWIESVADPVGMLLVSGVGVHNPLVTEECAGELPAVRIARDDIAALPAPRTCGPCTLRIVR